MTWKASAMKLKRFLKGICMQSFLYTHHTDLPIMLFQACFLVKHIARLTCPCNYTLCIYYILFVFESILHFLKVTVHPKNENVYSPFQGTFQDIDGFNRFGEI